jgi:hypothetical protein
MSSQYHQKEQSRPNHHRRWGQLLTTTASFLSVTTSAATSSSSETARTTTSQRNLHRPTKQRNLAVNPNLISYDPHSQSQSSSLSSGYTQDELSKISQQSYNAPHTWVQCPTNYAGYMASYDCRAYIYCKNGKMKEEGYTLCQEGLLFDNGEKMCVWADEVMCDPDNVSVDLVEKENGGEEEEGSSATYSKPMNSVTANPRYTPPGTDSSSSSSVGWSGNGDWGGYWLDGKWIDDSDSSATTTSDNNNDSEEGGGDGVWDNVEIVSWTNADVTTFPLPQLQPYDLVQEETTLPKEFISQEGWSSQTRSSSSSTSPDGGSSNTGSSNGCKKVIGYYANWRWYSNQERPSPQNMQFTKVDRINFAFFQTNVLGEIWGTDVWADAGILL